MKKSIAKRNFIALAVVAFLGLILSFVSFKIPFTTKNFNGFLGGMPKSYDLSSGVIAFFETSKNENLQKNYEKNLKTTVNEFNNFLQDSFSEFVLKPTEKGFKVIVPNHENSQRVLQIIDGAGSIEFKKEESESAKAVITGEHIKKTVFALNQGVPGVLIYFNEEGEELFYNLTSEQAGKSIYVYVGGKLFFSPQVKEAIPGGMTFISGNMSNDLEAKAYAFKFTASRLGVNINLDGEVSTVTATLGEHTYIYLIVLGALILVGSLVYLALKYKHLGLLAILSLSFQLSIYLLILNLMGNVFLSMVSLVGITLAYLISILNSIVYFGKIYEQFDTGKKIPISVKIANKNSVATILDINAPIFIGSVIIAWLFSSSIKAFATVFSIGILLSTLFTLLILKGFVKMYLFVNNSKFEKFGYKKVEVQSEEK